MNLLEAMENPFGIPDLDPADAARLHSHVEALAAEHGFEWREEDVDLLGGEADFKEAWFRSPILVTEYDYLMALHELGHLVLDLQTFDEDGQVLYLNEADVWEWALDEALIRPGTAARGQIRHTIHTHDDGLALPVEIGRRISELAPPGGDEHMQWKDERARPGDSGVHGSP